MKLTNAKILESIPVLAQAAEEKGMLGYAVMVNLRKLRTEVAEYSQKRDELLEEHGTAAGEGKYELTPDAAAAFHKALEPYATLEVEVAAMQVPVEIFYGGGLTAAQMDVLSWMVKEE